jgi:hypothetical protein
MGPRELTPSQRRAVEKTATPPEQSTSTRKWLHKKLKGGHSTRAEHEHEEVAPHVAVRVDVALLVLALLSSDRANKRPVRASISGRTW